MSVQTEIDRIITAVGAAYDAVEEKGGTLPTSETVANLAEAISSIPKDTHQAVEQATPSLSLNAATGVVTAEATQAAGLVAAGTKKATMQLATQAAKTVTPSAAQQTAVASGKYTTGNVVVAAVPTEAKTVELSMPSGNQTVSPSSGKFLSAVTVKKPATMLPENIKKGVSIGGVVGTLESGGGGGSTSETWVLNEATEFPQTMQYAVNFNSNGKRFTSISAGTFSLRYGTTMVARARSMTGGVYVTSAWPTEAYRKLVFDEAPTGDLLTWLTANGVKQPANLAVQPSKDVTITSNGTTEITPDAPYDVMEKANLTVNVPTGGSVDMRTINITVDGQSVSDIEGWAVGCDYGANAVALDSGTPSVSISVPNQTIFVISVSTDMLVDVSGIDEAIMFDFLGVSGEYAHLTDSPSLFIYACRLDATGEDSSFTLALSLRKNPNYQG